MFVKMMKPINPWRLFERGTSTVIYCGFFGFLGYLLFDTTGIYFGVAVGLFFYYVWGGVQRYACGKFRDWYTRKSEYLAKTLLASESSVGRIHHGIIAISVFLFSVFFFIDFLVWCYSLILTSKIAFAGEKERFLSTISTFQPILSHVTSVFDSFATYRQLLQISGDVDQLALTDFVSPSLLIIACYFWGRFTYAWFAESQEFNQRVEFAFSYSQKFHGTLWRSVALGAVFLGFAVFAFFDLSSTTNEIWVFEAVEAERLGLPIEQIHGIERYVFDLVQWFILGVFGICLIGHSLFAWVGAAVLTRRDSISLDKRTRI